jgi:hypothetical protein
MSAALQVRARPGVLLGQTYSHWELARGVEFFVDSLSETYHIVFVSRLPDPDDRLLGDAKRLLPCSLAGTWHARIAWTVGVCASRDSHWWT